tara:strand:- start:218 stop:601 length:384 start_codon:yes stop_codon:yes gene_type:complete
MPRKRRARTTMRKATRRARSAVRRSRKNGATIGGVSAKGTIKGGIGYSIIRKIPIFNNLPAQYQQPARMLALGVGSKAVGIQGMQHFTSTGAAIGVANFLETSNVLGGLTSGVFGGAAKKTQSSPTV